MSLLKHALLVSLVSQVTGIVVRLSGEWLSAGDSAEQWGAQLWGPGTCLECEAYGRTSRPQGEYAICVFQQFRKTDKGAFIRAGFLGAKDPYYYRWATEGDGAQTTLYHLCKGSRKSCKAKFLGEIFIHTDRRRVVDSGGLPLYAAPTSQDMLAQLLVSEPAPPAPQPVPAADPPQVGDGGVENQLHDVKPLSLREQSGLAEKFTALEAKLIQGRGTKGALVLRVRAWHNIFLASLPVLYHIQRRRVCRTRLQNLQRGLWAT